MLEQGLMAGTIFDWVSPISAVLQNAMAMDAVVLTVSAECTDLIGIVEQKVEVWGVVIDSWTNTLTFSVHEKDVQAVMSILGG